MVSISVSMILSPKKHLTLESNLVTIAYKLNIPMSIVSNIVNPDHISLELGMERIYNNVKASITIQDYMGWAIRTKINNIIICNKEYTLK